MLSSRLAGVQSSASRCPVPGILAGLGCRCSRAQICDMPCPAGCHGGARGCPGLAASLADALSASGSKAATLHHPPPSQMWTLIALQVCWLAQVAAHCQPFYGLRPAAGPASELATGERQAGSPLCSEWQPGPAAALLCEEQQLACAQGMRTGLTAALQCEKRQLACDQGQFWRSIRYKSGQIAKPQNEPLH